MSLIIWISTHNLLPVLNIFVRTICCEFTVRLSVFFVWLTRNVKTAKFSYKQSWFDQVSLITVDVKRFRHSWPELQRKGVFRFVATVYIFWTALLSFCWSKFSNNCQSICASCRIFLVFCFHFFWSSVIFQASAIFSWIHDMLDLMF